MYPPHKKIGHLFWNWIYYHAKSYVEHMMQKRINRRKFLKKTVQAFTAAGIGSCRQLLQGSISKKKYDLLIKDGMVFDGRGRPGFVADIGIYSNIIETIGKIDYSQAKAVINAKNLAVSPGFIDVHDHTSVELLVNPKAESAVHQGVTTTIGGNCGESPFPVPPETLEEQRKNLKEEYDIDLNWQDIKAFFARLEEKGMALNYATLVGQGTIRGAAMGFKNRKPTSEELSKMKAMVAENIKNGALGLSSGLEYTPGSFANTSELIELCKVGAPYGGIYATHMRNEEDFVLEAVDEAIQIAQEAGVKLQISHFKVCYPQDWSKLNPALAKIEAAKKEGIDIFCDRYPYIAASTGLSILFALWAREGTNEDFISRLKDPSLDSKLRASINDAEKKLGSWDKILISSVASEKNRPIEGKNVLEASKETSKSPYDFMRDLLIQEKGRVDMVEFVMNEENLKKILAHPLVGVGSDGSAIAPYGVLGRGKPHPRHYGTFPRVLGKYVREEKILPLEEMLKKITSLAAQRFGFERRGVIERNYFADLVVFDPDKIIDKATWTDPHQYPQGIEYVIINGQVVIQNGEHTGKLPGMILRKKIKV
jgi:N-acyl-D-amino-acid deacylase